MIGKLKYYWIQILSSFWFRPGLIALAALPLAVGTLILDQKMIMPWLTDNPLLFRSGIEGARQLLTAVIGSLITVTSLVFSMTVVAVSITASQLGPRIIQLFTKGGVTQFTLGALVANLVFAFVILRAISGPITGTELAPPLSLTVAILGTLFNLGLLIYFLHNTAKKIDADAVISAIGVELSETIKIIVTTGATQTPSKEFKLAKEELDQAKEKVTTELLAQTTGYIELIESERLRSIAEENDLTLYFSEKPGRFIIKGVPVGRIYSDHAIDEETVKTILGGLVIGQQRTMAQDIEFSIAAMVEIALRALSPGLNDPFTAITCIDQLAAGLSDLMECGLPQTVLRDEKNVLRLVVEPATYQGVLDTAFNGIRQDCNGKISIVSRLLESLCSMTYVARNDEQRDAISSHAEKVIDTARATSAEKYDRDDLDRRIQALEGRLKT